MTRFTLALIFVFCSLSLIILSWFHYAAKDCFTATALLICGIISGLGSALIIINKDL